MPAEQAALRGVDVLAAANMSRAGQGRFRTAAHFRRPTRFFEEQVRDGRIVTLALDDFTPLQGGVPIVAGGQFVGAIGVSGDSPQVDEAIALAGAAVIP